MQLRDGRKLNRTRYSSWVPSAHAVTGSPQPRTGPSLPSASPIHTELILTRWRAGTLQILLHLLLGFLGFIFLLQHGSVGCLPLQVANEVTHFSATLWKARDNKAVPGLPGGTPFAGGAQVPGRDRTQSSPRWVCSRRRTCPAGTSGRVPRVTNGTEATTTPEGLGSIWTPGCYFTSLQISKSSKRLTSYFFGLCFLPAGAK